MGTLYPWINISNNILKPSFLFNIKYLSIKNWKSLTFFIELDIGAYVRNLFLWSWSSIDLDFRGPLTHKLLPPHPQTSILNKLWNSIKSFIIPANFDYQWTFVQMNFNDFTVTENDLVNFYKILSLPAMAMTLNDLVVLGEWCMTIIMVMSNKCFRCQPQTTVLTNQKHNIKIQSVQLNHSVLSTILLWQS